MKRVTIDPKSIRNLLEQVERFVPAPWAVETCGEKGDGAYMIGVTYRGDDTADPPTPIAGFLPDFDEDDEAGDFIEYDRQELVAEVDFHNPGASAIADLLWRTPDLARAYLDAIEEIGRLKNGLEQITLVDVPAIASRAEAAELALTTAPRDAGERLTDHERGQVNIAKCLAVTDSISAYVWHHSVTQLLAIIARLTQKEPNNG